MAHYSCGKIPFVEPIPTPNLPEQSRQGAPWAIAVIDEKQLTRSCLTHSLIAAAPAFTVVGYASLQDWHQNGGGHAPCIALLCGTGQKATEAIVDLDLAFVAEHCDDVRVIVVSDVEDPRLIVAALGKGARGYIGMSSSLDVALAAIRLVAAGGVFVPASGLLPLKSRAGFAGEESPDEGLLRQAAFTPKQLAVIQRLRQGESNKIIAYKLNMEECTVKVHIRNIMQKIRARNRTEIAYMTNNLFEGDAN
ncbi:hypothetical protein C5L14_02285 [Labrys okinawensis]|uniref:HTH luxR-type domain-containing protein n=1 Tax=Labrys okinawensis TaxID=346911 RepID=A0A2S9QJ85_9HYPH|nr:hypothetical protein C5L14_02285 [Labrys okinawensis]